ncbi:MAG: hypothetical protein R2844_11410 [Caldilineales bacterium]
MTDYFSGAADLDSVLAEIDASWPTDAAAVGGTGSGEGGSVGESVGASAEGATSVGLTELANAYNGDYSGTVVSMSGPFTDEDTVKFENSIKAFEDATGIDIQYEGSKEFEASIGVRFDAGDPRTLWTSLSPA